MTESEWLACTDPKPMLEFLRGKASDRKLRLFAMACCRLVWERLVDERSRQAVVIAEAFADGLIGAKALKAAHRVAASVAHSPYQIGDTVYCGGARSLVARTAELATARRLPLHEMANSTLSGCGLRADKYLDFKSRCLRDLFGPLPFRPVTCSSMVFSWNDSMVPRIAQAVYDERAFDGLPILADALEDAGCDNEEVIRHCRSAGAHVRGCWAVDLLLARG
jgi:hypothetical protein